MASENTSPSDTAPFQPFNGGCLCGAVRYTITQPAVFQCLCVCTDCQAVGGGFGTGCYIIDKDALKIDSGEDCLTDFIKADIPQMTRKFCKICGTHVYGLSTKQPTMTGISVGTMDQLDLFQPQVAYWCRSIRKFYHLPEGLQKFDQQPEDIEEDET